MLSIFLTSCLARSHSHRRRGYYHSAVSNAAGTGRVFGTGIGLNVRSGPGTGYGVLTSIGDGTTVTVNGRSGNWWQISVNNVNGYCSSDFLSVSGVVSGTGIGLNVRSGPGTNYGVVSSLSDGAQVNIVGINNDWYKISNGWVSSQFIALTQSGGGPTPSPSGAVIRQGDPRFNSNIRNWGCAFMSLCWLGGTNSIDGCNRNYNIAVNNGWMRSNCYINDWNAIKPLTGARTYRFGNRWAQANGNEKEILQCQNARTSMHFVVGNKNGGIEYDPAYVGSVAYGDHVSKRFYGY